VRRCAQGGGAGDRRAGTSWDETDVDADPDLRAAYGDLVPVVLVDGREHGHWRVEEARLRRALAR